MWRWWESNPRPTILMIIISTTIFRYLRTSGTEDSLAPPSALVNINAENCVCCILFQGYQHPAHSTYAAAFKA